MTAKRSAAIPRPLSALLVLTALGLLAFGAPAQTRHVNLERLVKDAGIIFSGTVVHVATGEKDPSMNLYTTSYTFAVHEALFGLDGDSITIKQYGGEAEGKSFYPPGVPRFERGETVVVFFYPPSKIGMTSTVSKEQGKFLVGAADSSGARLLQNGTANRNLFRKLRYPERIARSDWVDSAAEGPLGYDPFISSVRNLVEVMKKR